MSERFCRTKQLIRWSRFTCPYHYQVLKKILDLERQLEDIRELKCRCQKQKYEEAAKLRDDEHRKELAIAQEQWEEDAKTTESKLQKTMLQM
jgi:ATP-dependent Clp protease ATP-binding subunit ClpC